MTFDAHPARASHVLIFPVVVFTVSCESTEYLHFIFPIGVCAVVIYPVGINLLYIVLLWKHHAEIHAEKQASEIVEATGITFLHRPFSRECFWWEIIDSVRYAQLLGGALSAAIIRCCVWVRHTDPPSVTSRATDPVPKGCCARGGGFDRFNLLWSSSADLPTVPTHRT